MGFGLNFLDIIPFFGLGATAWNPSIEHLVGTYLAIFFARILVLQHLSSVSIRRIRPLSLVYWLTLAVKFPRVEFPVSRMKATANFPAIKPAPPDKAHSHQISNQMTASLLTREKPRSMQMIHSDAVRLLPVELNVLLL